MIRSSVIKLKMLEKADFKDGKREMTALKKLLIFLMIKLVFGQAQILKQKAFSKVCQKRKVWGHLTDGQRNAMVKILDKEKARKAEWATRDGKCEFVGTVGERHAFEVTVKHVVELEGIYGISYLHICRDADDNVIIYKGTQHWEKGAQVTFMAKVKDHGVRDGVKQKSFSAPQK